MFERNPSQDHSERCACFEEPDIPCDCHVDIIAALRSELDEAKALLDRTGVVSFGCTPKSAGRKEMRPMRQIARNLAQHHLCQPESECGHVEDIEAELVRVRRETLEECLLLLGEAAKTEPSNIGVLIKFEVALRALIDKPGEG